MTEVQHHNRRFTDLGFCSREDCPHLSEIEASTKGVNNFRVFSLEMTEKMAFVHGAAKVWSIVLSILLTTGLSLFIWIFHEIYPAFRQGMADYYIHHPDVKLRDKSLAEPLKKLYIVRMEQLQHAKTGR